MTQPSSPPIGVVMIIDDNAVDQELYARMIKRSGLVETVLSFLSAEDALAHLVAGADPAPDAILLDINMPRMNGFEFLDAAVASMGEQFAAAVIMMLTTSLDPRDLERAKRYSVVKDYCDKPLTMAHLERLAALLAEEHRT